MSGSTRRGERFIVGMIAALCVAAGLLALFGVPSAAAIFSGLGGIVLGVVLASVLVPRREVGPAGRTVLAFLGVGGMIVGGVYLPVFDFYTVGDLLAFGLYFGFWSGTASKPTPP